MLASHVHVVFVDKQITWPLLVTPLPVSTARKPCHLASDCPGPVYCNICKSPAHQARSCPFSWSCLVNFPVSTLETTSDNSTND